MSASKTFLSKNRKPRGRYLQVSVTLLLAFLLPGLALAAPDPGAGGEPSPIHLQSRTFVPEPGIDAELEAAAEGRAFLHLLAQLAEAPDPGAWSEWQESGIHWSAYVGGTTWVIRVDLQAEDAIGSLESAFVQVGAVAFASLLPSDKASAALLSMEGLEAWAFEEDTGRLYAMVGFFPDTDEAERQASLEGFEVAGPLDPRRYLLTLDPERLGELLAAPGVEFVEPGPRPEQPLMELSREATGAEALQRIDIQTTPPTYHGYSGDQVRIANTEGLNSNHDDFWNHDSNGNRTTPRWLGCPNGNGRHGTMTAGIILGNGFQSDGVDGNGTPNSGAPYEYRGMAPEALFDCYSSSPDLSSHSFTQSHTYSGSSQSWDARMWGSVPNYFFPHIGAAGNEGMNHQYGDPNDRAYYSTWRNSKNELVVGMISDQNFKWTGSSMGPSLDGRLKPELSAPATRHFFPTDRERVGFELDYVILRKNGFTEENWHFDGSGSGWTQGWTDEPWWAKRYVGTVSQSSPGGSGGALASSVTAFKTHWALIGTITRDDGTTPLNLSSHPTHQLEIRYRYDSVDHWNNLDARARIGWTVVEPGINDYTDWYAYSWDVFPIVTDGQWHVATVDIGAHPDWSTQPNEIIDILQIYPVRSSGQKMRSPGMNQDYQASGGSSAASPVAAGAAALLLDQMKDDFGVVLGSTAPSPFRFGSPGTGVPYPSTFRALLVHGARDLAHQPRPSDLDNPDTGEPTHYFHGPDEVTGYGMVDVGESSRVLADHTPTVPRVVEKELIPPTPDFYYLNVPANRQPEPLRVTLAWDDPPSTQLSPQSACKLLNDLDLRLISPSNITHEPWDLDSPAHYPLIGQTPPSEVRPAQQRDNDCDNLEQVFVEAPEAGTWIVRVTAKSFAGPPPPTGCSGAATNCQRYSLILGSPPKPANNLQGGKVVFASDRVQTPGVDPRQLFVQAVGSTSAPQQITSDSWPARFPEWSHDGEHIVYVTSDILVGGGSQWSVLRILDAAGNQLADYYPGQLFGSQHVFHPSWSRDGKRIVFTYANGWSDRALGVLEFAAPYDFANYSVYSLVPPGMAAMDGVFSPDGSMVYFDGNTGDLYQVPSRGGTPLRLFGDGYAMQRSFDLSISPDGHSLSMNSELYKDNEPGHLDEEVVELRLRESTTHQRTQLDGHQYASYALGGSGEFVSQSTANPGGSGKRDIYLQENGVRVQLFIDDTTNQWNDDDPHWWKASPPSISVPSAKSFCRDATSVVVKAQICNFDSVAHPFEYALRGLNAGAACSISGPTLFTYLDPDPITVPAGTCVDVRVRVERPSGMNAHGQTSCYVAEATNLDNGISATDTGILRDARNKCAVISDPGDVFSVGDPQNRVLRLANTTGKGGIASYRFRVEAPFDAERYEIVSLDRQPPGSGVVGKVELPVKGEVELPVEVTFTEADPLHAYDLVFELDSDGDGVYEGLDSIFLRTEPAGSAGDGTGGDGSPKLSILGGETAFLKLEGGTPGRHMALYLGRQVGETVITEGACRGSLLELDGASLLTTVRLGADGTLALPRTIGAAQLGRPIQALDLATCRATEPVRVPLVGDEVETAHRP